MTEVAPALTAAGLRLLAPDAPGFGRSPALPRERYETASVVGLVRALIDERGIERAILMGHSWCWTIVTAFAGAYPERVDGLVLVDSGQMDYQDAPGFPHGRSYAELVEDAWPAIAEEGIPILLLLATEPEDTLELNGQAAGPFAERFPDAEIHYLADAGHDLFADAGPELARIVADWAERLPPR